MKLLVVSDIHGTNTGLMTTLELASRERPDLVVVCGDITNFGPVSWAEGYLNRIPVPTLAIPGNCDPVGLENAIERTRARNLHKKKVRISGLTFIGAGGADFTPYSTLFEFHDDTFTGWLNPLLERDAVLVTHAPPYGCLDINFSGKHRGSRALRRIVEKWEPILVLSGHIHEAPGIERLGRSVCVNPGPAKEGKAAVVELLTPDEAGGKTDMEAVRGSIRARLIRA